MPIPVSAVDNFVEEEGEQVRHFTGLKCFCHGADGQPDPNCQDHESGGWLFVDEKTITGLVTDITRSKELMETGAFMPGDAIFSPLSTDTISEGDKIIFTWPLPHGQGDPLVRGGEEGDSLYYEGVQGIFCIDEDKIRYAEGTDYLLSAKKVIWQWNGKPEAGKAPSIFKRYTIKYHAYIEWLVFVPPVTRISHGEDFGSKVMLRKKHLMEQK